MYLNTFQFSINTKKIDKKSQFDKLDNIRNGLIFKSISQLSEFKRLDSLSFC